MILDIDFNYVPKMYYICYIIYIFVVFMEF